MKTILHIERKKREFTQIDNGVLEDPSLSFKSKGLIAYLLSKPDDWVPQIQDLINHSTDGRAAIYSALKELRLAGYAKLQTIRDEKGRICSKIWRIREWSGNKQETPKNKRNSLNRDFLKQVNLKQENRDISNTEFSKTKKTNTVSRASAREMGLGFLPQPPSSKAMELASIYSKFSTQQRWFVGAKDTTSAGWTAKAIKRWAKDFETLLRQTSYEEVVEVMKWFFQNWDLPKMYSCETGSSFADKFTPVRKRMLREIKNKNGHEDPEDAWKTKPTIQVEYE